MENQAQKLNQSPLLLDYFLVCGLGSLGQNCLVALKEFGVKVIAIEQNQAQTHQNYPCYRCCKLMSNDSSVEVLICKGWI